MGAERCSQPCQAAWGLGGLRAEPGGLRLGNKQSANGVIAGLERLYRASRQPPRPSLELSRKEGLTGGHGSRQAVRRALSGHCWKVVPSTGSQGQQ